MREKLNAVLSLFCAKRQAKQKTMNLFKETRKFLAWFFQVIGTFLRIRPWTTLGIVLMSAGSRVTSVVATLIPLKVILLAGSSGVPSYFRFFIGPGQKEIWIIILALGAVACYFFSVALDAMAARLSEKGSQHVLQEAEAIPLLNNQQDAARDYYSKFCRVLSDATFVLTAVIAGLFLNFWLFVFLTALIFAAFAFSALPARTIDQIPPGKMAAYIRDDLNNYTKILSTTLFLASFLFLLALFFLSESPNIIGAILSIIILRQMLGAQTQAVKDSVSLGKSRHEINALVFRDVQFKPRKNPIEKVHRELFNKETRQKIAEKELSDKMPLSAPPEVQWVDPAIPGLDIFAITARRNDPEEKIHLLQQVFAPKQYRKIEHELFLFQYVPRKELLAPDLISVFFAGPFQCQICSYGAGKPPDEEQWQEAEFELTRQIWSCRPPPELVRLYSASAPLLYHRLNRELISHLEIAVDTRDEQEKLELFRQNLAEIRKMLRSIPLYVYNPDFNRKNAVRGHADDFLVISWSRWTLEPLGAGLPKHLREKELEALLENVQSTRKDIPQNLSARDLTTAAMCFDLEGMIRKKKYKASLGMMDKISTRIRQFKEENR